MDRTEDCIKTVRIFWVKNFESEEKKKVKEDKIYGNQYKGFRRKRCLLGYWPNSKILKLAYLSLPLLQLMSSRRKMNKTTKNLYAFVKTLYLVTEIATFSGIYLANTTAWGRNQNCCFWSERGWCMGTSWFDTLRIGAEGVDKDLSIFFLTPSPLCSTL